MYVQVQDDLQTLRFISTRSFRRANANPTIVSIASVTISNSRRPLLTLSPNAFPAVRYIAKRDASDDTPIEYIQVAITMRPPIIRAIV